MFEQPFCQYVYRWVKKNHLSTGIFATMTQAYAQ